MLHWFPCSLTVLGFSSHPRKRWKLYPANLAQSQTAKECFWQWNQCAVSYVVTAGPSNILNQPLSTCLTHSLFYKKAEILPHLRLCLKRKKYNPKSISSYGWGTKICVSVLHRCYIHLGSLTSSKHLGRALLYFWSTKQHSLGANAWAWTAMWVHASISAYYRCLKQRGVPAMKSCFQDQQARGTAWSFLSHLYT